MTDKLPLFKLDRPCVKCGATDAAVRFVAASLVPSGRPAARIERLCRCCGHSWYERPLDQADPGKQGADDKTASDKPRPTSKPSLSRGFQPQSRVLSPAQGVDVPPSEATPLSRPKGKAPVCHQRKHDDQKECHTTTLLLSPQAAAWLGVKPQTLRKWRWAGTGPRYVRLGVAIEARVVYRLSDLEAWLATHSFESTAEETVARATRDGMVMP